MPQLSLKLTPTEHHATDPGVYDWSGGDDGAKLCPTDESDWSYLLHFTGIHPPSFLPSFHLQAVRH